MIEWVHELALEWGAYLRSTGNPYQSRNIIHRMMKEGSGASHGHRQAIPLDFDAEQSEPEVLSFHRAFLRLPEISRDVIYVMYVPKASTKERMKALLMLHSLSKSKVYEVRGQAHAQIWGYIDAHLQMMRSVKNSSDSRIGT